MANEVINNGLMVACLFITLAGARAFGNTRISGSSTSFGLRFAFGSAQKINEGYDRES